MQNNQEKELILLEDLGMLYAKETSKQKSRFGIYVCYCGNKFKTQINSVNRKLTKSCGCLQKQKVKEFNNVHGLTNHRLYFIWNSMINRCENINNKAYKNYGARGITVCERWHDIKNFIEDMYPTFQDGLTLDRINNDENYETSNCRWTIREIQNRNTRKLKSNNTSGYRGVSWNKNCNKFITQIKISNKKIHIGLFNTAFEAAKSYDKYIIDNNLEHTKNFN